MRKKLTMEQAKQIMELVVEINGTEGRKIEGGKPAVNVYMHGHTADLNIDVYEQGWRKSIAMDKSWYLSYSGNDYYDSPEECIKYLEKLKEDTTLKDTEQEKEIC